MTWARATALAGSLCLHSALLAFALKPPPSPGPAGPDAGGDESAIFSAEPVPEPPATPPAPASNLPDIAESLPATHEPLADEDLILPLDSGAVQKPAFGIHAASSGGARVRKAPGLGTGKGRGGGGGDGSYVAPAYLSNPAPAYPLKARLSRQEGMVLLEVTVTGQGRPADVVVLRSSGDGELDRAAVAAVRRWTFHPATAGGQPVSARVEVPVRFRLK